MFSCRTVGQLVLHFRPQFYPVPRLQSEFDGLFHVVGKIGGRCVLTVLAWSETVEMSGNLCVRKAKDVNQMFDFFLLHSLIDLPVSTSLFLEPGPVSNSRFPFSPCTDLSAGTKAHSFSFGTSPAHCARRIVSYALVPCTARASLLEVHAQADTLISDHPENALRLHLETALTARFIATMKRTLHVRRGVPAPVYTNNMYY